MDSKVEKKHVVDVDNIRSKKSFDINLKKIRINNTFATASKKLKDEFSSKWIDIKSFIDNSKYNNIIGMIDDIDVLVVGEHNVMFMAKYDSLLDRIYDYIDDFEDLLKDIYNIDYKVIFLPKDEWDYEKNNYVMNLKKGVKYSYIKEKNENYLSSNSEKNNNSDIDKVISLVGEDVIVYE